MVLGASKSRSWRCCIAAASCARAASADKARQVRATCSLRAAKAQAADARTVTASDRDAELFTAIPDADDERAEWTPKELEAEEAAEIEAVIAAAEADSPRDANAETLWRREQTLLDEMQAIAERTRHTTDAKMRRLIDWIRENLCPNLPPFGKQPKGVVPTWNNRRVLIFTENREGTKNYLKTILEQRNGRIDRKLQPAAEVHCYYFVLPQRVEDRVLEVPVRKTETIKKELGSLSKVIDDDIERRLGQGIRHRDAEQLAREIDRADLDADKKRVSEEELEAARERQDDLKAQIARCQSLLEASRAWTVRGGAVPNGAVLLPRAPRHRAARGSN